MSTATTRQPATTWWPVVIDDQGAYEFLVVAGKLPELQAIALCDPFLTSGQLARQFFVNNDGLAIEVQEDVFVAPSAEVTNMFEVVTRDGQVLDVPVNWYKTCAPISAPPTLDPVEHATRQAERRAMLAALLRDHPAPPGW